MGGYVFEWVEGLVEGGSHMRGFCLGMYLERLFGADTRSV